MIDVKTWQQRCDEDPAHAGIVSYEMVMQKMMDEIEELRAALAATEPSSRQGMLDTSTEPSREPNTPGADAIVDEYADEYEWDDGETYHVPTDKERILLADFGHGLVSLLHESGLLKPRLLTVEPAEPSREVTREPVAWMRADGEGESLSTMAYCITDRVKQIWLGANPKQVERYTIPLYGPSIIYRAIQEPEAGSGT